MSSAHFWWPLTLYCLSPKSTEMSTDQLTSAAGVFNFETSFRVHGGPKRSSLAAPQSWRDIPEQQFTGPRARNGKGGHREDSRDPGRFYVGVQWADLHTHGRGNPLRTGEEPPERLWVRAQQSQGLEMLPAPNTTHQDWKHWLRT